MATPLLRNLPSVNELLEQTQLKSLYNTVSQSVVVTRVRQILDDVRAEVQSAASERSLPNVVELAERIARKIVEDERPPLRPVINATGVLLSPGLGGAPLAEAALEELVAASRDYASLETDLAGGDRAERTAAVESLLREQTGAEAALVVSSQSAGLVLALAALCGGREAVVARGQVGELADGSRLTDLVAAGGARLREVGSANRARLADYESALNSETTGAIVRVQSAHYRVVGATHEPALDELARLARDRGLPLVDDLGLGGVLDLTSCGLAEERVARASIEAGADVVLFGGEKLLGGPCAGILVGRRRSIDAIARHPLARALAVDKLTLAALAATLRLYRDPDRARREIPLLHFLSTSVENLRNRAERLAPQLAAAGAVEAAEAIADVANLAESPIAAQQVGTWCVALTPKSGEWNVARLGAALRTGSPSVVGRVRGEKLLFDLRSVFTRQDQALVAALSAVGRPKA